MKIIYQLLKLYIPKMYILCEILLRKINFYDYVLKSRFFRVRI